MIKNILITGSNGFIGSYFINQYKTKYAIKIFSFRKNNFDSLSLVDIDTVVHLSALVHQRINPTKNMYNNINTIQTIKLAQKAKQQGVKHFVFMSTIAVYGIEKGIINEKDKCKPTTKYGISKLKAEQELLKLESKEFKVSIIRSPIVYGYNAPGNIKNLINLIKKIPILPFGNIKNKRDMIYVGNLCYFMDTIITRGLKGIFLVSDEKPISTTKLIELISQALNRKIFFINVPFFKKFLKLTKPFLYQRLYENLEINNSLTKDILKTKAPKEITYDLFLQQKS